ncbi:MAG: hypothetical protein AMJ41_04740, partial [candidate division Zixibacteria bacterium DG_27]
MREFTRLTLVLILMSSLFFASGCGPEGSVEKPVSTSAQSVNVDLVGRALYGPCGAVFVKGDYAYVGAGGCLLILNIAEPNSPFLQGRIYTPGLIQRIELKGNHLYLADGEDGLRIIDVSNPEKPKEIGAFDTAGEASDLIVYKEKAYVADGDSGLVILDISNPRRLKKVGG